MVLDSLNDKFTWGKFKGCELGFILLYSPDYFRWVVETVDGSFCYVTDNVLKEMDLVFPNFIIDESFLTSVQFQRDSYQEPEEDDYYDEDYEESSYYERQTYGRYSGSYAQDEMGYSDDDIDTIFDGDPSAYWNID